MTRTRVDRIRTAIAGRRRALNQIDVGEIRIQVVGNGAVIAQHDIVPATCIDHIVRLAADDVIRTTQRGDRVAFALPYRVRDAAGLECGL